MSKQEIENHQGDYGHGHGGSGKIDGKEGDVEIEEQVHHEHVEEISPELELLLKTDPLKGLSDDEVHRRRETFGKNELVEKKRHPLLKFLGYFTGAIAYLIEIAVICSAIVGVSFSFCRSRFLYDYKMNTSARTMLLTRKTLFLILNDRIGRISVLFSRCYSSTQRLVSSRRPRQSLPWMPSSRPLP